jgi:hypothetical protein
MSGVDASRLVPMLPALLAAFLTASTASAGAGSPAPLFADDTPLEMTLELPLTSLLRQRDDRPGVAGAVVVAGPAGEPTRLDVEITTRGHFRLEKCAFPPLGLNLRRSQVGGTVFAGQDKLKLVTLCRDATSFEDYLELERLVYRMYQQVSDYAFRVRPLRLRYVDTDRGGEVREAPAFFLEPVDGVAERLGMSALDAPPAQLSEFDGPTLAMLGLFQFLMSNTDWSVTAAAAGRDCCHNIVLLARPDHGGGVVAVPYDFDSSGIVDASYAEPSAILKVRSVRDRVYRGFCVSNGQLEETIATLNARRPAMEAILESGRLGAKAREKASKFLAAGYQVLNDSQARQRQIVGRCRGS